jgi:hypothetical protein
MLPELGLEWVLVAADLVVAPAAAPDQHLVAVVVAEVEPDLHYPPADLHQAVVLGYADLEVDKADLDQHSHYYLHWVLGYPLD